MNVRAALTATLAFTAIVFVADSAIAERVDIKGHSKKEVKASCDGAYWPTSSGGTYGCVNKDGSGIVCGGSGKDDKGNFKNSCDTFRLAPHRLPTRAEAAKAEAAEKTQKK